MNLPIRTILTHPLPLSHAPVLFLFLTLLSSCGSDYTPRPRGYFRIAFPEKQFNDTMVAGCPYSFEIPSYARLEAYNDSLREPCWKYLRFPQFNAEVFLSYKKIDNNVGTCIDDAYTLAYKHSVKADAIDETLVSTPNRVHGLIYDISGNAASPVQFYATDSVHHFIRGALYFNHTPKADSLQPVIDFLRKDIERLIITLKWRY